nr:MAG TPA: hypothetical protein [Caudoviricetes sp.]DAZ78567.1 MAG TPA: hypothetical protein [Caudoviricetes sp.]
MVKFTITLLYDRVRQSTIQNIYSKSTIMLIIMLIMQFKNVSSFI